MSHSDYIRRERAQAAREVASRAMGAAKRAASVLASEDRAIDAAIGVEGAARAIDTYFGALDARADIVRDAADRAAAPVKSATAARVTREIRASDTAVRYADRPEVTGALHRPMMRVKRSAGGSAPNDVCGPRMARPGIGAEQIESARQECYRKIRECGSMWASAQNGAVKRTVRDRLRAILHVWGDDRHVCAAIEREGFDVERLR